MRTRISKHLASSIVILSTILCCINGRVLNEIGRLYIPLTDIPGEIWEGNGAENSAIDTENERIFVADGRDKSVNSMDFDINPNVTTADIEQSKNIYLEPAFTELKKRKVNIHDVTCVAMLAIKRYIMATIVPVNHSINNGWLAFVDPTNQSVFNLIELDNCFLPDHVTSTSDGNIILVACEAEPDDNESESPKVNPPGSVGYIDVSSDDMSKWEYKNIVFDEFDEDGSKHNLLPEDIYYPIEIDEKRFSLSAEPEHIVVDDKDQYAYVGLQENNAVAVLDIAAKEIINVFSFGFAYFGDNGGLDASDKDGKINIVEYDELYGMRQPDDIDYFRFDNGRQFLFTANEGDSKGFDEVRVGSSKVTLDAGVFGSLNETKHLQDKKVLGRLKISNILGVNMNETFDALYTFSSRDFTVYEIFTDDNGKPINISLHYSSNNDFEMITAKLIPDGFNSDYSGKTFDERSDAKGPEPEGITVGECGNGRKYVFICLERVSGIFAYDFTDINNISFADYYNNRNFSLKFDAEDMRPPEGAGDIGPEQMRWIPGDIYGEPVLVVSHPQSASVTMYRIDCGEIPIIPSTTPSNEDAKDEGLTTLEIVAIAVGSFAILSIIVLIIYIVCKRMRNKPDLYQYTSMHDFHKPSVELQR